MRKLANRHLVADIRELAMWSMALLVNTNTWEDMKDNWRLICLVFWNYNTTDNAAIERYYASLLSQIEKISNDQSLSETVKYYRSIPIRAYDIFDFDDEDAENDVVQQQRSFNENIESSETVNKRLKSRISRIKNDRLVINDLLVFDVEFFLFLR